MREKSVKIASKMSQKCAEHLWGRTPFGRYRPRDTQPSRGFSDILCDFSYVPFLLPSSSGRRDRKSSAWCSRRMKNRCGSATFIGSCNQSSF